MNTELNNIQLENTTQDKPIVSVVMSFHNSRHTLARSIQSLLWQTFPYWELILLDDGSNDDSAQILELFKDPRIHLFGDSLCRGLPVRLNQGIALARGEYVARMDADDIAFPQRFARQVAHLQDHPEIDLLATAALLVNAYDQPMGLLAAGQYHVDICNSPWYGFSMPHPTWMGRTDWFRKNPYDELSFKAQDQALLYMTYRTSCFAGLPDVLLGYRYDGLSARKTLAARYHFLRVLVMNGVWKHLLAGSIGHGMAAARDLASIALGMSSFVIRARAQSVDRQVLVEWEKLRMLLANYADKTGDK
ncbi:MAG: glycosyltransferase family A protein [Methylococcaceae bacterium]